MLGIVFWILILGILWRVPEFRFLIFFILANNILYTLLLFGWQLTSVEWPAYLLATATGDLIFAAVATPLILFRKWQKGPKAAHKDSLDREMERIRAEIAARDGRPPAAQ